MKTLFDGRYERIRALRRLTNNYAHINDTNDQATATENIQRVEELFIHASQEEKLPTDTDLQALLTRISDITVDRATYFDDRETSTEASVDKHIDTTAPSYIPVELNDYQILLARMESIQPVVNVANVMNG